MTRLCVAGPDQRGRTAARSLPMVAAWLAAIAIRDRAGPPVAEAPYRAWLAMWHLIAAGSVARAIVVIPPAAIPLGLAAAGGASPGSAVSFDRRQWRHQARAARARIAVPGAVPLTTRAGDVVAGSVIRAVGHPAAELARLPYARLRSHQVVIGGTGTGKATRCWRGVPVMVPRVRVTGEDSYDPAVLGELPCPGAAPGRGLRPVSPPGRPRGRRRRSD